MDTKIRKVNDNEMEINLKKSINGLMKEIGNLKQISVLKIIMMAKLIR